ncbi:uncharacterized protein LOC108676213 [Hyalella azteca]|uniref:Uncharacterized protein LOC108676213 n=1 Tax=Hyalella azteca TaxID=294128 RepID=A0A8B7P1B4_HYAAZ|nr:uncharacterized protein LOC108676213 [Hyalella azteca]XP_047736079.1 uncharacterized protein LOC108676213 [Hyalella azteca]
MGNSSSYKLNSGPRSAYEANDDTSRPRKSDPTNVEVAKMLRKQSMFLEKIDGICESVITKHLCNGNESLGRCIFRQMCSFVTNSSELLPYLSVEQFIKGANQFISLISDGDQLKFYINGFADGDQITREQFLALVRAAHELSHVHSPEFGSREANALLDAAMPNKKSVGVSYLCKWCLQHCHRLVHWMHRHIANRVFSPSFSSPSLLEDPNATLLKPEPPSRKVSTHSMGPPLNSSSLGSSFKNISSEDKSSVTRTVSVPAHNSTDIANKSVSLWTLPVMKLSSGLSYSAELMQQLDEARDEADADTPVLDSNESSSLNPSLVWLLTCSLPLTYTKHQPLDEPRKVRRSSLPVMSFIHTLLSTGRPRHWEPLYFSDRDGLGVNRFEVHVFNYRGPTLTIFTAQDDDVAFCLALDEEWKDSKNFWGGEDCCLLQIRPKYKIVERGEKLMYFNLTWRGFPTGVQVGDNYESRALTVNKEMNQFQHHNIPYKLGSIEVWGCGSQQIRENQKEFKKRQAKDVEIRRKVKITTSEWAEHPDRYLLELAGGRTSYADYKTQPSQPPA